MIVAMASYKQALWVFKGPYKGSIHIIEGVAPTGDNPFRKSIFRKGIKAISQRAMFEYGDDVGFLTSDGDIQSLKNIQTKDHYKAFAISRHIQKYLDTNLNFSQLDEVVTVTTPQGFVLMGIPTASNTSNNMIIGFDYRFDPIRWFRWPAFSNMCVSMAIIIDPDDGNKRKLFLGGNDGYIRKAMQDIKTLDNGGFMEEKVKTP